MGFWKRQRVLVTGGKGFLGSHVVELLTKKKPKALFVSDSSIYDLRKREDIQRMFKDTKPTIIIHLAARVGGIQANKKKPAEFFYDNIMIGTQVLDMSKQFGVNKFVGVGTVCSYPKHTPVPFKEENLWNGYPEETNAPYGLTKRMLLAQSQAYRQQYGFNAIYVIPTNLYGPRDNFDLNRSHVIPALIKKCLEAKEKNKSSITVWGSGKASREFLYVEDAARAVLLAAEKYNSPKPVNIGNGEEFLINDIAAKIAKFTGYKGKLVKDATKPDGQPRRCLDVSKARKEFGFEAKTSLNEGLKKTIIWYKKNKHK